MAGGREDVGDRYRSYGWEVMHLGEDIAVDTLTNAFRGAQAQRVVQRVGGARGRAVRQGCGHGTTSSNQTALPIGRSSTSVKYMFSR